MIGGDLIKKVLAIDMGATSIRGIIGYRKNDQIEQELVFRLKHKPIQRDNRLYWDWDSIISSIKHCIIENHDKIDSIAIDTWGVDFGILSNEEMKSPISYRDENHTKGMVSILEKVDREILYRETGNQIMPINTLFQLETYRLMDSEGYENIDKILMVPDFINYLLTGKMYGEKTICSTTQMFDMHRLDWNYDLMEKLGIDKSMFPPMIDNFTVIGSTRDSLIEELRSFDIPVISIASHDTASAIYAAGAYEDPETLFLSSGTWLLFGCVTDSPIVTDESYRLNMTNEIGCNNKNILLKNITGLFLIEQLKSDLEKINNRTYTYDEITSIVEDTESGLAKVDVDSSELAKINDNFIEVLEQDLLENNQQIYENKEVYFRIIYESLALKLQETQHEIETILDKKFKKIEIFGGGAQSKIFIDILHDILKMEIVVGEIEAASAGNVKAQLQALENVSYQ